MIIARIAAVIMGGIMSDNDNVWHFLSMVYNMPDVPDEAKELVGNAMLALTTDTPTGRWVKRHGMMPPEDAGRYYCSECGAGAMRDWRSHRQILSNYCPSCGAKLKGNE